MLFSIIRGVGLLGLGLLSAWLIARRLPVTETARKVVATPVVVRARTAAALKLVKGSWSLKGPVIQIAKKIAPHA